MLLSKVKDLNLRNKFLKIEHKIRVNKFVFINLMSKLLLSQRLKKIKLHPLVLLSFTLNRKNKILKNNKTKIIKRCLITNRSRSVYKPFNLSRNIYRELLSFGLVPGYKKAVW